METQLHIDILKAHKKHFEKILKYYELQAAMYAQKAEEAVENTEEVFFLRRMLYHFDNLATQARHEIVNFSDTIKELEIME